MGFFSLGERQRQRYVGLERSADGLAIAGLGTDPRKGWQVEAYQWLTSQDPAELRRAVKAMGLKGLPCNYVLSDDQYQLFLLEAPPLAGEELVQAMVWQVKDLLGYPVTEAVIDVIALPPKLAKGDRPMVYVVAAARAEIEQVSALTRAAGLDLNRIDISELALGNLIELWGCHPRGEALALVHAGRGELLIFADSQLMMSRKFELNAGDQHALPLEQLTLELQRTLDYYERQLGQPLPAKVHLTGKRLRANGLEQPLDGVLDIPIELMHLDAYWFSDSCHGQERDYYALAAIGGALGGLLEAGYVQSPSASMEAAV
ncbi:MAG: hypothetical protein OIF38_04655 [Cellvibrionaceae bacterium]|nr:hypothetical protein [Cellvibrionaceae bacterium]